LFAAAVRQHIVSRPKVVNRVRRTFAVAFLALGARLALIER
jgi:threonine/homoserine/homoserine lactone efflux protein